MTKMIYRHNCIVLHKNPLYCTKRDLIGWRDTMEFKSRGLGQIHSFNVLTVVRQCRQTSLHVVVELVWKTKDIKDGWRGHIEEKGLITL